LALDDVTRILENSREVIRSKKTGSHGQALFALREKRNETTTQGDREASDVVDEESGDAGKLHYFILLPVDASMRRLRDTIARTIREERAEPFFVDEILAGAAWVNEISVRIRTSDVVIADITRLNPNVMFELGIAHGLGKPLILLLNEDADVDLPTDLAGYQYLTYTPGNLSSFVEKLRRTARQLEVRKGATK
jgi:hypothetical protein